MKTDRIQQAIEELDECGDSNHDEAVQMLCCFAKLLEEIRYGHDADTAKQRMLEWFFEREALNFDINTIKGIVGGENT